MTANSALEPIPDRIADTRSSRDLDEVRSASAAEITFRDLVVKHQKALEAFILRRIGNQSDAEELTQQAFVAAAASMSTFRGESALSTWLYGVAMNLVRNHLSREPSRRYRFEGDSALEDAACAEPNPQQHLERKQLASTLMTELKALPPAMRDVLMLVGVQELSYEDAAVMLSVPLGTVRSRLSRGRDLLRRRMVGAGIETTD